ncbi:hypothetical protein [Streptomyces cinnamoneus]|uniref:hypothetical protein n=1 Tax=Streptomyces cinnamoneus TaxID=53446 RepID=UPI0037AF4BF4
MANYQYRCAACGITWDQVTTKRQAEEEREQHRRECHGGGAPDGDGIGPGTAPWPSRGVLVIGLLVLALFLFYNGRHGQ